jgi:hypothetical protein
MIRTLKVGHAAWLTANPPTSRDIRKLSPDFPTAAEAERERQTRISILKAGTSRSSAALAEFLEEAQRYAAARVGCCPLLVRQFQIWFVAAALELHSKMEVAGDPYTLLDLKEAVDSRHLHKINWRRLHARLRKRIARILGKDVVVIGVGEVEYDPSRGKWQPHYHIMVYGASRADFKKLRKNHYAAKRRGPRPMVRSSRGEPATWFSYMAKLIAFGKRMEGPGGPRRVRLQGDLSRAHFRYLASRVPTSFIFCVNCSLVKRSHRLVVDQSVETKKYVRRALCPYRAASGCVDSPSIARAHLQDEPRRVRKRCEEPVDGHGTLGDFARWSLGPDLLW